MNSVQKFKIVLTASDSSNRNCCCIGDGDFAALTYKQCLSARNAKALTEDIVFTDGDNDYNCTVSVSSRWYDNGVDDYAPHNFFATTGRISASRFLSSNYDKTLTYTIKFTDDIDIQKISSLSLVAGKYGGTTSYTGTVNYQLYDDSDVLIYETALTNETHSIRYQMNFIIDPDALGFTPEKAEAFFANIDSTAPLIVPIAGSNAKAKDVFVMQFYNCTLGQHIDTKNISIEHCTFDHEVETHDCIRGYKVFTDDLTGRQITLNVYMTPEVCHSDSSDSDLLTSYDYMINHTNEDTLNIECKVIQNGVDLTGRKIILTQETSDHLPVELRTVYNDIVQTNVKQTFDTTEVTIPSDYLHDRQFRIVITLTDLQNQSLPVHILNHGLFTDLTLDAVLTTSTVNKDAVDVIRFKDIYNNAFVCELYQNSVMPTVTNYSGAKYYWGPSNLFDVTSASCLEVASERNVDKFEYMISFRNKLPIDMIKNFSVIVGNCNSSLLGGTTRVFEYHTQFDLYDMLQNKLLYSVTYDPVEPDIVFKPFDKMPDIV